MSTWKRADATWMREGRWGVFQHVLADTPSTDRPVELSAETWNRRMEAFDAPGLAAQLADCGAAWHALTLGQNSGYYCSPNATYQDLVGDDPSRCSTRDLFADVAAANRSRGIREIAYFTCFAPCNHPQAIMRLGCTPDPGLAKIMNFDPRRYQVEAGADARLSRFQRNWEAVIREWSLRWGDALAGWWIDGCFAADQLYQHDDEPNFRSFAEALKAGNSKALIAFNPGVREPVRCLTSYEDYTAGELNQPSLNTLRWGDGGLPGRPYGSQIDGAQFHVLIYLGYWWGGGQPRMSKELAAAYTAHIVSQGGAITWDVPVGADGRLPDPYPEWLAAIGAAARSAR